MVELDPFKNDETQTVFEVLTEGLSVNASYLRRSKNFVDRRALKHLFKTFYISQGYKLGIVSDECAGILGQRTLESVLNRDNEENLTSSKISQETLRSANIFAENAWGEYRRIVTSKGSYGALSLPSFKSKMLVKAAASFYSVSSSSLDRYLERNSAHKVNDFYNFLVYNFLDKRVKKREVEAEIKREIEIEKIRSVDENVEQERAKKDEFKLKIVELKKESFRLSAPIGHDIMNFMHSLEAYYRN